MLKKSIISVVFFLVSIISYSQIDYNRPFLAKVLSGSLKDIDGNSYKIVKIGEQIWMQENLRVTHYNNGDSIPNIKDSALWVNYSSGAYCDYDNDTSNVKTYGRLYNWYAASDQRNVCPAGWHVPSDTEFAVLINILGGPNNAGGRLKERGFLHWEKPNAGATNESKFTALPAGQRYDSFLRLGSYTVFWNKNEYFGDSSIEKTHAYECYTNYDASYFIQAWALKYRGMSVRCIKNK
jgi:uncharacterized protein (TIGR02145 family)